MLAFVSFSVPVVGVLHGINAFLILWLSFKPIGAATRSIKQGPSFTVTSSAI